MGRIRYFAAALVFTACSGNVTANNANAAGKAARTPATAPTQDALMRLETSAYEAWKSKDAKFWDTFLADRFVGWGDSGRLDKASATREYTGAACDVRSYALSDEHLQPLGERVALLTFRASVDGTCSGQKLPDSWAATVFVRHGDKWQAAFHAEAAVVDPKAPLATSADRNAAPKKDKAKPAAADAGTAGMLAVEKAVWEAWRKHDTKNMADLTARDISFINVFGSHFATKAAALKDWSGTGCDVKSVSVTDATGTMLSPTVGILTFKGAADGSCYGQRLDSGIWGTSIYVRDGAAWKWTFGINVPAGQEGLK
jgi:hypothetical protein